MKRRILRFLLVAAAVAYAAAVGGAYSVYWALAGPASKNLQSSLRWNPSSPELWTAYGRSQLYDPEDPQPREAAASFLRAVERNPLYGAAWQNLAAAYQQIGDTARAEAALRSGLAAAPHSPEPAWRLANFLILQGRFVESFPYLKTAADSDRTLGPAVFDLGWKVLEEPDSVLREVVPTALESRVDYLYFLIAKNRLAGSYPVWEEIRQRRFQDAVKAGYRYVGALLEAGDGDDANRVWAELLEDTGRTAAKPPEECLTNGDFELDLPDAGLDWHFVPVACARVALDNFAFQHGSRSLRVTFDGTANQDFWHVFQKFPVEPNRDYQFRGYLKTENISSASGMRFVLAGDGGTPEERFEIASNDRVGSNPWMLEQLNFHTGPHMHSVTVYLRRYPSDKLNNLLGGKVWIDNLSVTLRPR